MADQYQTLSDMVVDGDVEGVKSLAAEFLAAHSPAQEVLNQGLLPGMDTVGQLFRSGEMFIPEVLMSARAMTGAMEILKPHLSDSDTESAGTVVIGTVEGDIHNIGKDLVAMMLEGAGFKVINLGIDVTPEAFVKAVAEHKPNIVGMSALLTTTMPKMTATVDALREAGFLEHVKVMAGGAPVSEEFVLGIGGHAYASDAAIAVDKARALVGR